MSFSRLVVLLPCQGLEDFSLARADSDAEQLMAAWTGLWHPLLVADCGAIPDWMPAESPPDDPAGHLVVVPGCCGPLLPEDWPSEAAAAGAMVLRDLASREALIAAAGVSPDAVGLDPAIVADFFALGYCHLQVELLVRRLRYMNILSESALESAAVDAARAAVGGNGTAAREHLQSAFDRLHEAREYCHPSEPKLLDLTLAASTTLGSSLRAEWDLATPCNLLISGEVVAEMARREPATLDRLKHALADNKAILVGGEFDETPLPLLSPEAIRLQLRRGLAAYRAHLGRRPTVFGRRRFGLTPALPQILCGQGFSGAIHCTLDDGQFPTADQERLQWEGLDGTTIESLGGVPLDAGRAAPLLALADKIGEAASYDQAILFAHWPGRVSTAYGDLRRAAAYGPVLGRFVSMAAYLDETSQSGRLRRFSCDDYRSPYLVQEVAARRVDPISRWVRYCQRRATLDAIAALSMGGASDAVDEATHDELATAVENARDANEGESCATSSSSSPLKKGATAGLSSSAAAQIPEYTAGQASSGTQGIHPIVLLQRPASGATGPRDLDARLAAAHEKSLRAFARFLVGEGKSPQRGPLFINPHSFTQEAFPRDRRAVAVPPMGFSWLDARVQDEPAAKRTGWFGIGRRRAEPPLAEEYVLRNEFCEVHFDRHSGAIGSIFDYKGRDPLLAQQIALRTPHGDDPEAETNYSIMAADEMTVTESGPAVGEIVCRGRLMDRDGRRAARYRQTTRTRRGSRVLEIEIDLDVDRLPEGEPWESYYAVRFAWKDESAELRRAANLADAPTELTRIESPYYLDIRRATQRATILCGGLPYHRRLGRRKLDALLVVRGERARSFRLGIGVNLPHAMSAALGFLAPPAMLADQPSPPTASGWLFHLDCRNVLATHWQPLSDGARQGFRVRLLETDGRGVALHLRCYRPVASAQMRDPADLSPTSLQLAGDAVVVPLGAHQWAEVDVFFR